MAEAMRRLRRRPDRRAVGSDIGDGTGGAERRMALDRPAICRGVDALGLEERAHGIADADGRLRVIDRRLAYRVEEMRLLRERRRLAPLQLELPRRAHGVPLILGDDADEIADAHDAHAAERRDRALVDG